MLCTTKVACHRKAANLSLNDIQQEVRIATAAQHLSNLDVIVALLQLVQNILRGAASLATVVTHTEHNLHTSTPQLLQLVQNALRGAVSLATVTHTHTHTHIHTHTHTHTAQC